MRITTFRGEASVADLADKLFSGLDSKKRKKAEAALLKANPQLARLDRLEPGAVLTVPSVVGVKPRPQSRGGTEEPVKEGSDLVARDLKAYAEHLDQRHARHQEQLKEQAALLKDKNLVKALRTRPDAEPLAAQIEASLKARSKAAGEERKRLQDAVKRLTKTLADL